MIDRRTFIGGCVAGAMFGDDILKSETERLSTTSHTFTWIDEDAQAGRDDTEYDRFSPLIVNNNTSVWGCTPRQEPSER